MSGLPLDAARVYLIRAAVHVDGNTGKTAVQWSAVAIELRGSLILGFLDEPVSLPASSMAKLNPHLEYMAFVARVGAWDQPTGRTRVEYAAWQAMPVTRSGAELRDLNPRELIDLAPINPSDLPEREAGS